MIRIWPSPCGYGTPGPKVAESVLRATEYNRKPAGRTINIGGYKVNSAAWDDSELPSSFHETTGNFHPDEVHRMFVNMLEKNQSAITQIANNVVQRHMSTNCDVLTKGRRTWCPITRRSIPSATALKEMEGFFKLNLGNTAINCFEWKKQDHKNKENS